MIKTKFRALLFLCLLVLITTGNSARIADQGGLVFSTYLGGTEKEYREAVIVADEQENIYIAGSTFSSDFPVTPGAYDTTHNGDVDAFVSKFDSAGNLIWSTFWGGAGLEIVYGIAVDENRNVYITGQTGSYGEYNEVFVIKLNAQASQIVYSTFLGGIKTERPHAIAIDKDGNAYITGYTSSYDFPITHGAYDTTLNGSGDAFVAKLDSAGNLVGSSFLGGSDNDFGAGIAVDENGNAYVFGVTNSSDFPVTNGAYDTSYNGHEDTFVTKLNSTGTGLVYSTFLGGTGMDEAGAVTVDKDEDVYLVGFHNSPDFPTTPGAYDSYPNPFFDVFITKLNSIGSGLVYSTYLGGSSANWGFGIAIDQNGNAYVRGHTYSVNFPTTSWTYDASYNGNGDTFVTKLNSIGSGLVYSTYLGGTNEDLGIGHGIAVDESGGIYVVGYTESTDFPVTLGAFDTTYNGQGDIFVTKIKPPTANLIISSGIGGTTEPVPGTYTYDKGANVQVKAIPQQGYRFKNWTGDVTGTINPITITLNTDKSITANFIRTYTLTIKTGTGGTTNPSPGIYGYDEGEQVSIRAIPNQDYEFANWSGDVSGTSSSITITMNSDKTITANFKKIPDKPTCFLSSIFGSSSKETETFRNFRDRHLMSSSMGRTLVSSYYRASPFLAKIVSKNRILRATARITFTPVVKLVGFL